MKNKFFILFFYFIFFQNYSFASEFKFEVKQIIISEDNQKILANKGKVITSDNELEIYADNFEYKKNEQLLEAFGNGKAIIKSENLSIKFDRAIFNQNDLIINASGNIEILQIDTKIKIKTDKILFNKKNNVISSKNKTVLDDNNGNIFSAENFKFEINKNLLKFINLEIKDKDSNLVKTEIAFVNTKTKKLFGKEISIDFDESNFQETNSDARLKAKTIEYNENNTILKKGAFTTCKKRDGCPPWQITAAEVNHDKKNKRIYYKNAFLKFYDTPIFYFPRFFHPDPSVERQSGFLVPTISNSNNSSFLQLPYFLALDNNKDATFSPRMYDGDKFLLQTEYRQVNLNSEHITDFSFFKKKNLNQKNHFFYKFKKDLFTSDLFETKLNFKIQQTSNDTYLKAQKIEGEIINNYDILENSLEFDLYSNNLMVNMNASIFEDLNKTKNDRYEYLIPNINIIKNLNTNLNGNLNLVSNTSIRKYNTNILEKINQNNLIYSSYPKINLNGFKTNHEFLIKNINSDNKNSSYKNKSNSFLSGIFQYNSSIPLIKKNDKRQNIFEPKLSVKIAPPHTRDNRNENSKVNIDNIYSIDRLSNNTTEGEFSITYGGDYIVQDKTNSNEIFKFNFANNLRFNENDDISNSNQMGEKTSNFFTKLDFNPNNYIKSSYENTLKNNLSDLTYENFSSEISLNKIITKFDYTNENNTNEQNSYLKNETILLINDSNSVSYTTRENKTKDLTEYYNLIYQYKKDCLVASIEYNKDFYSDRDLKQNENILFKLTFVPLGQATIPNVK